MFFFGRKMDKTDKLRLATGLKIINPNYKEDGDMAKKARDEFVESLRIGRSHDVALMDALLVASDGNREKYEEALKAAQAVEVTSSKDAKATSKSTKIAAVLFLIMVSWFAFLLIHNNNVNNDTKKSAVKGTWKMQAADYGDQNRWFSDGVIEIKNATTKEEAEAAAQAWLEKVKLDPVLLASAGSQFLGKEVDESTLVDADGWATTKAVKLVNELKIAIGMAKITPAEAPADGWNEGVQNGQVVIAAEPGITGDRKAIRIDFPNSEPVWIMARCGNPVLTGDSDNIPTGETDEGKKVKKDKDKEKELTPKSSNIKDYMRPGIDSTKDSGTGTKPPVNVTTSAESKPPKVVTKTTSPGGITETASKKPGSETGITAPGAETLDDDREIPDVEEDVNEDTNDDDPGVPSW